MTDSCNQLVCVCLELVEKRNMLTSENSSEAQGALDLQLRTVISKTTKKETRIPAIVRRE